MLGLLPCFKDGVIVGHITRFKSDGVQLVYITQFNNDGKSRSFFSVLCKKCQIS
jgi:hypothetical protein